MEIQKALKQHLNGKISHDDNDLFNWLLFMNNDNEEVCEMLTAANPAIGEAITVQRALSMDKGMRHVYTRRMMAVSDEVSKLSYAREDGRKEVAARMLAKDFSIDDIMDCTALNKEQVLSLI